MGGFRKKTYIMLLTYAASLLMVSTYMISLHNTVERIKQSNLIKSPFPHMVVDNFLDTVTVPLATVAGSVLFASQFIELGTFPQWALAIIAGGGTAATIAAGFAGTRQQVPSLFGPKRCLATGAARG